MRIQITEFSKISIWLRQAKHVGILLSAQTTYDTLNHKILNWFVYCIKQKYILIVVIGTLTNEVLAIVQHRRRGESYFLHGIRNEVWKQ